MSPTTVVLITTLAVALLAFLLYVSFHEVRVSSPAVTPSHGLLPVVVSPEPLPIPPTRGMKVIVAVDGSPCSDRAVQGVAMRPWPAGTEVHVLAVISTRMPDIPDPLLMLEASHVEDLEAERTRAPARVQRARDCLASISGVKVHESIVEGDPEHVILAEADRLQADLIVLGSHGYGPIKRRLLGSVSQAVALHAPCSVEIVRCREASAAGTAGADG